MLTRAAPSRLAELPKNPGSRAGGGVKISGQGRDEMINQEITARRLAVHIPSKLATQAVTEYHVVTEGISKCSRRQRSTSEISRNAQQPA